MIQYAIMDMFRIIYNYYVNMSSKVIFDNIGLYQSLIITIQILNYVLKESHVNFL